MGHLRVRSASLALRLPEHGRQAAPRLTATVEKGFIPAVLDALRRELDAIYGPEALIRIDRLRLRLTIGPDVRDGAVLARQVARDLAEELRAMARMIRPGEQVPLPVADVRIWPDRPTFQLSALHAALHRMTGPDGVTEPVETVLHTVLEEPAKVVAAVVEGLAATKALLPILREARAQTVERLKRMVDRQLSSGASTALARAGRDVDRIGAQDTRPQLDTGETQRAGGPQDHATPRGISSNETPDQKKGDPERRDQPGLNDPRPAQPDRAQAETSDRNAPDRRSPPRRATPSARAGRTAAEEWHAASDVEATGPEANIPRPTYVKPAFPHGALLLETRWGRLPCLLNVALRLEMPERLWQIGVPEGAALAGMFSAAVPAAIDPMVGLLAPEFPQDPPPVPQPADWACEEFRAGVLEAAAGWTGVSPDRIEARRAALAETSQWRLDDWGAAALLVSLEAVLERPLDGPALAALFACSGVVEVTEGEIAVRLPIDAIDLELRRAGLDEDPGYLSWLDRRMVLEFGSGDESWLP